MKNCNDFQQQYLLDGGCKDAEVISHFAKCPQCQAFAQDCAQILPETPAPKLSEAMEKELRMACMLECARLRRKHFQQRLFRALVSAAAVVMLIIGAVFHQATHQEASGTLAQNGGQGTQTVAQNKSYDDANELVWNTACTLSENELDILETDLALYVFNP